MALFYKAFNETFIFVPSLLVGGQRIASPTGAIANSNVVD